MKKAFTMAECLITIGIIGIVASMTLPSLITKHQKNVTIAQLQKIYTVLNQAFTMSQARNGEFQYWDDAFSIGSDAFYEQYWEPYFNHPKVCKDYEDCGYDSVTPWKNLTGTTSTLKCVLPQYRRTIILNDGTLVSISITTGVGDTLDKSIYIDLNNSKGPNRYGRDFFIFTRTEKNGIQPFGYNYTQESLEKSCSRKYSGYGHYCAAKIMRDGWKISDDYPW